MKTRAKNRFLLPALIATMGLLLTRGAIAQTFKTVYSFSTLPYALETIGVNGDGAEPQSTLTLSGNTLYGATFAGGAFGRGTIFAINTDGTGFTNLHNITDGAGWVKKLLISTNMIYGTETQGGSFQAGTIFSLHTDGTGFTNLYNCDGYSGAFPEAPLILLGGTLYGVTSSGFDGPVSRIFTVNTDGSDFTNFFAFTNFSEGFGPGGLILSGNTLFGTTSSGGNNSSGIVFQVNTDGSAFSNLYNFSTNVNQTNGDGAGPQSDLVMSGNRLYGTTLGGGVGGNGTIFAINADGTGFQNLHGFSPPHDGSEPFAPVTNSDGAMPSADLVLHGDSLYGTTYEGATTSGGTLFAINTDGTGFTNFYVFSGNGGSNPRGGLALAGTTLFGTTSYGGAFGAGTVFSITFSPTLGITLSGTNVILTWPTNVAGFDYTGYTLQSTTNLASHSWSAVSPSSVVVNGQETVTNAISGMQMFYRLSQ